MPPHPAAELLAAESRLRSMVARRCVFVHVPKAAGLSVARSLFGHDGGGHLTIRDYRRVFVQAFGVQDFDAFFKFSVVRNPWSRTVSAYTFLKRGGINATDRVRAAGSVDAYRSFGDFVRGWLTDANVNRDLHLHFRPQRSFLTNDNGQIAMDFVGRVETIAADYAVIAARLGVATPLGHENQGLPADYRRYYDDETASIVARVYREDAEAFKYTFDGLADLAARPAVSPPGLPVNPRETE